MELRGVAVEELVGSGRHGEVWRGRTDDGTLVAVRIVDSVDPVLLSKLRREAAIFSSVGGDHVLRVRDVREHDGRLVVVSDWACGGSLNAVLEKRSVLAAPEVVTLVGPLAGALAEVHRQGIAHGAVGAGAVMFDADGRPLLADFGLSSRATSADDVRALATLGLSLLDAGTAPPALVEALRAACADDPLDRPVAGELALSVLSASAAAPIRLPVPPKVVQRPVVRPAPAAAPPEPLAVDVPRSRASLGRVGVSAAGIAAMIIAVVVGVAWGHRSAPAAATLRPAQPVSAPTPNWATFIRDVDAVRERALATRDGALLTSVEAGEVLAADRLLIRKLTAASLWLHGWRTTSTAVGPLSLSDHRVELRVTDARSAYELVGADGSLVQRVPARAATRLLCVLVRTSGGWRLTQVVR